jgi:hypothetical protein
MKLTSENVERLFAVCLKDSGKEVEGIMAKVKLDVTGHEQDIKDMLAELPDPFHATKGGGWSFLEACNDWGGNQWTGLHMRMDQLFMLGIAAESASWLLPREYWSTLPGGMPYVVVKV